MVAFDGSERCRQAEAYYHDYLQDDASAAVPRGALDHIRGCQYCQRRVENLRGMLSEEGAGRSTCPSARDRRLIGELERHLELLGERVTCARVRPFLPGLLDPSVTIRIPTPVTVHVDNCPECAGDLESLREGGQIAERADSGVITVCTIKEGGRTASERIEGGRYQDYPIDVKVLGGRREGVVDGGGTPVRRRRFRPLKRVAILAAALIPLAIMFSLTSPSATGLTVGQASDTMYNEPQVIVTRIFYRDNVVRREERWLVAPRSVFLVESAGRGTFFDLKEKERLRIRNSDVDGPGVPEPLTDDEFLHVEATIEESLGFPRVLRDRELMKEPSEEAIGADVYKLVIAAREGSGEVEEELRIHIDRETGCFRKREYYRGTARELYRTDLYEYPDAAAFQRQVDQAVSW